MSPQEQGSINDDNGFGNPPPTPAFRTLPLRPML